MDGSLTVMARKASVRVVSRPSTMSAMGSAIPLSDDRRRDPSEPFMGSSGDSVIHPYSRPVFGPVSGH